MTPTGVTTQTLTDVPAGSYVTLASCGHHQNGPALWVSAYPGIAEYLIPFQMPAFTVQQESTVITILDD